LSRAAGWTGLSLEQERVTGYSFPWGGPCEVGVGVRREYLRGFVEGLMEGLSEKDHVTLRH